jgi:hypothetical protein
LFDGVSWFWGLTCDFLAENGKRKIAGRVKTIDSVVWRFAEMARVEVLMEKGRRMAVGLRALGFFAALRMTAEAKTKAEKKAEADPLRG